MMNKRLTGSISAGATLKGFINAPARLTGVIQVPAAVGVTPYDGPYEVTPKAWDAQTLETAHKLMTDDVTVFKVPYYETINLFDGKTAYIAEEV